MSARVVLATVVIATAAKFSSVAAQAPSGPLPPTPVAPAERMIEVAVNYGINIPHKGEGAKGQAEALEAARRMLYEIAAGECKVLLATVATTCRLERLNVQSNVQRHAPGSEMIIVGANSSYRITLK